MASSYARAAKLGRSQRKKKATKTNAASTTTKTKTSSRSLLAPTQRTRKNSHRQYPSSFENGAVLSQQQQQQTSGYDNHGTNGHYCPSSSFHQQGYSAASNSQPSSVSFHASNVENQENAGYVGFSQLTCSQSLTNDSRAGSSQNSIVAPSELHQNSAASNSSNASSRSSSSCYPRNDASLFEMATGQSGKQGTTMNASQQQQEEQQQEPSSKSRRSWLSKSGVASVLSKVTTSHRKSYGDPVPVPSSTRSMHADASSRAHERDDAPKILDRDPKPQDTTTATSNETSQIMNETSNNSLITDHFKKIPSKQAQNEKGTRSPDTKSFAKLQERLVQKEKDLEALFTTKQQGFEALALDIETKQAGLQKLASELELKMKGFDDHVQQETTGALARLTAATNDGVDKIHRGVESFHKLVADAKASFQSSVLQPVAQKLLPLSVCNPGVGTTAVSQRNTTVATSEASKDSTSKKSDDISSSGVFSIPSTVHVPTAPKSRRTSKRTSKAKTTSASGKKVESTKVVPTRASSRVKKAKRTISTPKRATVRKDRSSKASCVTPSTKGGSRMVPPVSITVTRRTSTKKRLGSTSATKTSPVVESTRTKKRSSSDAPAAQQRGRKKARSSGKGATSPEAVTDSQSSSESTFVSPILKEMSKRRKKAKARRHYGGRSSGRVISTNLDDSFDFISQES